MPFNNNNGLSRLSKSSPFNISAWILISFIAFQFVLSLILNIHNSFFLADDLFAIELAHKVNFWAYIQEPIDVHRVPLHRAVNYLIHHLLPMNFLAATLFLLSCHAAGLILLHRVLQILNPSPLNLWLITAYALNAFVYVPIHWWAAGLHRFPYVLASITSCYFFVRLHQQGGRRNGIFAVACMAIALGFYIKGMLLPLYWAAILFCLMNFRDWKKYRREYITIAVAGLLAAAYVGWYALDSPDNIVAAKSARELAFLDLRIGMSIVAQVLLQMSYRMEIALWINSGWLAVLIFAAIKLRSARRPIFAGLMTITINLLMIALSSRASSLGIFIMFAPRYYYELLFLIVIFTSLALRNVTAPATMQVGFTEKAGAYKIVAAFAAATIYGAAGWGWMWSYAHSKAVADHRSSAHYERNLISDIDKIGIDNLNLADSSLPKFFLYDAIQPQPLPLSTYLSWHGLHPKFEQKEKSLYFVDRDGHLHPANSP